jgi:hypothetical protein
MTRSSMRFIGASQLGLRVIPASTRPYDFVRVAILQRRSADFEDELGNAAS